MSKLDQIMHIVLTVFTFFCGVLAHAAHLAPWNPDGDGERAGTVESAFGAFTAETGVGIAAGVAGGLVPVYGQMADARDTAANIKNVWDNPGSGEAWAGLAMSGAAWIPGAGDAAKVAYRVGSNVTEEIGNASIRRLSKWEIRLLERSGIDPHDLKPNSRYDLFIDRKGDIIVKPKSGVGPGESTYLNINDL